LRQAAGATLAAGTFKTFLIDTAQGQTATSGSQATVPANERIQIALIGAGGQGQWDTTNALRVPGVEIVAAADVYDGRLVRAKEVWGKDLFTTRDFREILARPDVDAVIIATPDHWHVPAAIAAIEAGKDVYLEKPMIHKIEEGQEIIDAQRKSDRIVQIGSQRVSSIVYKKAKELIAAGAIGEPNLVEANWNRNTPIGAWQYSIPPDASPQNIDWDRFLGNAPKRPFEPIRLFRWRNYQDYGTGVPGDLYVHLFTGIHYILNSNGPTRIQSTGGIRYWNDGRDVPDVMLGIYDYPKTASHPAFNLALKVNFMDGGGGEESFRFVGSEGVLSIGWDGITVTKSPKTTEPGYTINTFPAAIQEQFLKEYRAKYPERTPEMTGRIQERYVAPDEYSDLYDHFRNFFASVRSRQPVVEDVVFGFRAAGPAVLTNTAHFENRAYKWDPEAMKATAM
jgi:predicted dehydrogenase